MKFTNLLTLLFIALKLLGKIDWSWWFVLSPTILVFVLWLTISVWWESKSPLEKYKIRQGLR